MKKMTIAAIAIMLVLLSGCDLEFSNAGSVIDDVKPAIDGAISSSAVVGSDIIIKADDVASYQVSSWIITYKDGTEKEISGSELSMPLKESGSYKAMPVYTLVSSSELAAAMKNSAEVISSKVFNKVLPEKVDGVEKNQFTATELEAKCGVDSFYINLGKVADNILGIKVGRTEYREGEAVKISIGMNSFFCDLAYNLDEEGNLWVNVLSVYFANILKDKIIINDSICLDLADSVIEENKLDYDLLGFVSAHGKPQDTVSSFTRVEGEENTFDVTVRCGMEMLRYCYTGDEHNTDETSSSFGRNTGAAAEDMIIIRTTQIYNGKVTESLGFDVGKDKGYYLNGWYTQADWDAGKVSRNEKYTVIKESIILDEDGQYKGVFTATFNITPERPQDGH